MRIEERELNYEWLASDGAIDVVAHMSLLLKMACTPELFAVTELIDVRCDSVAFRGTRGAKSLEHIIDRTGSGSSCLREFFAALFRAHYLADVLHLEDDVQDAACARFSEEMLSKPDPALAAA